MPITAYEFTKSSDLIAQKQAQVDQIRQAAVQANDPVQMQLANSQALIDTLFGDPEIQKAQEVETVIADSMNLEREEGEDDLDFQIRQQKAVREGTAKLDPNVAVQANQQLAQLQVEKEERRLLMEDRADEKELTRRETVAYEHKNTHAVIATDANGNAQIVSIGEFDETGKEYRLRMDEANELRAANPNNSYEVVSLSDLMDGSAMDEDGNMALPTTVQRKFFDGLQAINGVSRGVKELSTTLQDNMFALTFGSENEATAGSLATRLAGEGALDFYNSLTEDDGSAVEQKKLDEWRTQDDNMIESRLGRWGRRADMANIAGTARAQVKELAYKLAKVLDPGGRLSDQDVDMAIEMIVGNGNPAELKKLLEKRLAKTRAAMNTQIEAAKAGQVLGKWGRMEAAQVDALMDEAYVELEALSKQIQEWKGGQQPGQTKQPQEARRSTGEPVVIDLDDGFTVTMKK